MNEVSNIDGVRVHESAYVDKPGSIGKGTSIWHYCHISKGVKIGESYVFGQNVFIAENVKIGNRVKVQNNVAIYTGCELEDEVFLGSSCVLTNVTNPRSQVKRHHHTHIGMNGRFDTLQAAVILGKWPHFEDEVKARNQIGARYSELLKDYVTTPIVGDGNTHVYAQYTVRVDGKKRGDIVAGMKDVGIPAGIYYPKCFHEQPVFQYLGYEYGDFSESEKASREVISLPMHPFIDTSMQEFIRKSLICLLGLK